MIRPQLLDTIRGYNGQQLVADLVAGLVVGIVALPLAIAFAIASGLSPEKGIITAVVAGFLISALGGSRVQIGGPTGAFIVIVAGIAGEHGVDGLMMSTIMAGFLLIAMGLSGLGSVIRIVPYPLVAGFTTGIAVIIFSSQVKELLGLQMDSVPVDFLGKWKAMAAVFPAVNVYALSVSIISILLVLYCQRFTRKIPGSLLAIIVLTAVVAGWQLPVETIGSRFGAVPSALPAMQLPAFSFEKIKSLLGPACTIAMLGAVESLLSAVVADGMTGTRHRSDTELVAQGTANIFSGLFGGMPATGAIARTATNVKSGARTPVAGIVHALLLLLILVVAGRWAAFIPLPVLAGILVVVAWNMSEWKHFVSIIRGKGPDALVLLVTFLLTLLADLSIAIAAGMLLAMLLFTRDMIRHSTMKRLVEQDRPGDNPGPLPPGIEVFEVSGPFFFGAAWKFTRTIELIESRPAVLILDVGGVPFIDATGIRTLRDILGYCNRSGIKLLLSGPQPAVMKQLLKSRLAFAVGKRNITTGFEAAVLCARRFLPGGPESKTAHSKMQP